MKRCGSPGVPGRRGGGPAARGLVAVAVRAAPQGGYRSPVVRHRPEARTLTVYRTRVLVAGEIIEKAVKTLNSIRTRREAQGLLKARTTPQGQGCGRDEAIRRASRPGSPVTRQLNR